VVQEEVDHIYLTADEVQAIAAGIVKLMKRGWKR